MSPLHHLRIVRAALALCPVLVGIDAAASSTDTTICPAFARELGRLSRGEMPEHRLLEQALVRGFEAGTVILWDEIEPRLREKFTFAPDALDAASDFASNMGGSIRFYEAGGSNPFIALIGEEGTLHCQGTIFFVPSDGKYQRAEILASEHRYMCWNEHATIVMSDGEPLVLVSHEDPRQSRLTIYRVERPQAKLGICDLQIDFNVDYDIDPATCGDATCQELAPAMIAVARKLDDGWLVALGGSAVDPADVPSAVIKSLQAANAVGSPPQTIYFAANFDGDRDAEYLTVEQNADQSYVTYFVDMLDGAATTPLKLDLQGFPPSRSPWTTFTEPNYLLPMSQGGKVYLVHIGAASFSWRTLEGYLATAYEWSGDRFNLVAGAQLNRVNASVKSITELH